MNSPDPIDIHVGKRLKYRRMLIGLSQTELGDRIGVSFQQIQKYETGENRISAGRLFELSKMLDVPVGYFFEGISSQRKPASRMMAKRDDDTFLYELISKPDVTRLNRAFIQIKNKNVRRSVIGLIRSLGGDH